MLIHLEVYFVQSQGNGETVYRGRAPLFSQQHLLYEGYHTHKPGSFSWPFVVEIPTSPDAVVLQQAKHQWKARNHFLSTDDYIPGHSMPPTFQMRKWGFGYRWHIFVEYVIKVDVKEAQGARMVLPPSSRKASLPIMVRDVAKSKPSTFTLPLATQFTLPDGLSGKISLGRAASRESDIQSQTIRRTVKTSKFFTWDRAKGTPSRSFTFSDSLKDKTRALFDSDSLPAFTFDITVSIPKSIHLLAERGIPFVVDAVPVKDDGLTTIPIDRYPDIRIDNMTLEAGISTYLRFKSIFPRDSKTRYDVKLLDRQPVGHVIDMSQRVNRMLAFIDSTDEDAPEEATIRNGVDLSRLPGLAPSLVSAKMGLQTEKPLAPTFNSYIISREYTLRWKLELDVAGERVTVSNHEKIRVKVLAPDAEDLDAVLGHQDANEAGIDENDDKEDSEDESMATKVSTGSTSPLQKMLRGKKAKQEEAAEETSIGASPPSSSNGTLRFEGSETLPTYQQAPTDFGYRHEILERPPRYEAE